jgi:hypothetical protein
MHGLKDGKTDIKFLNDCKSHTIKYILKVKYFCMTIRRGKP